MDALTKYSGGPSPHYRKHLHKEKRAKKKGAGHNPLFLVARIKDGLVEGRWARGFAAARVHRATWRVVPYRRFLPLFLWKYSILA
jgi:hypothetical protein